MGVRITASLDAAIKAVCPIHGVSVGRAHDRASWRIDFKAEATQDERDAAEAVLAAFDPDSPEHAPQKEVTVAELKQALITKGVISKADVDAVVSAANAE